MSNKQEIDDMVVKAQLWDKYNNELKNAVKLQIEKIELTSQSLLIVKVPKYVYKGNYLNMILRQVQNVLHSMGMPMVGVLLVSEEYEISDMNEYMKKKGLKLIPLN